MAKTIRDTCSPTILAAQVVRWGLPWLIVLTLSASAAYGMTAAVAGAQSVAGRAGPTPPAIDAPVSSAACDPTSAFMLHNAVANGWIPARSADYCGNHHEAPLYR